VSRPLLAWSIKLFLFPSPCLFLPLMKTHTQPLSHTKLPTSTMSHPSHQVRVRPPVCSGTLCEGWQTADICYVSSKPPGSCTPPGELRKTVWGLANRRHLPCLIQASHQVRVRPPVSSGKLCEGWQTAGIYHVSSKPPGSCTPPGELRKTM
jgi:hypothetical protein